MNTTTVIAQALKQNPLFELASDSLITEIAQLSTIESYAEEHEILQTDIIPTAMFIIVQGIVIVHEGDYIFTTLGTGSFLGEYSMLDLSPGTVTASCANKVTALKIVRSNFEKLMSHNEEFRKIFFSSIARRLRKYNQKEQQHTKQIIKAKEEKIEIISKTKEIERQTAFILSQGDKVSEQNFKITESIQYAKRIQKALLPSKEETDLLWPEHFILYKPKSIVGGDFYWTKRQKNKLFVTAADCTGHGVPGAFMCMLGITALNQIVDEQSNNITAAEILNRLRINVIQTLKQRSEGSTSRDGMDMSFCIIDFEQKSIQFAGANNPVYIVRQNDVIQLKADKMPVGRYINDTVPFVNTIFEFEAGDSIYLFSDGYSDQFDTENKYKFGPKRFRELLSRIADLPMNEQKIILTQTIKEWRGLQKQLDDIVVIGLKL